MDLTEGHEQDLHDFMQSLTSNEQPSPQQSATCSTPGDDLDPEEYVQALLAEFAHQPDEEAYYDAIYEDIADDTDDEEEDLWDDDDSDDEFFEETGYEDGGYSDAASLDQEIEAMQYLNETAGHSCVSNFSSHVAAVKEDCCGCDHMRELVGLDSEDVSASLPSSSAPSLNRMTDFQLKQRALTFNIYDFCVSYSTNNVLFLFICHH